MKKGNRIVNVITIGSLLFLLSACGSKKDELQEKYVCAFDDTIHYEFSEDGTYAKILPSLVKDGESYSLTGTYSILEDNQLLMRDDMSVLYEEFDGKIYKDYLCSVWKGELPKKNEDTKIDNTEINHSGNYGGKYYDLRYFFFTDGTYSFSVFQKEDPVWGGDLIYSKKGTYEIEKGKVVCTNDDGTKEVSATTYFTVNDEIYGIWYVAE